MSTIKITNGESKISLRTAAKVAGFGLLFMFLSGIFASIADTSKLYETSMTSLPKLRMNIVGDLMMLVFDVVAAVGFFYLLKPVNKIFSMLAAWFRLMHVAVYGAAILNLVWVVYLLSGGEGSTPFGTEVSKEQIMFFLKGHEFGFKMGLVFFGFHFLVLGYLILKSGYLPKILGVLILILAMGYLFNSIASFLMPNYDDYQTTIQIFVLGAAFLGELALCLWLLFKGNSLPEIQI